MRAKNVVHWQDLNKQASASMDLKTLRRTPLYQDGLRMKWEDVRHQALLAQDCLRDLGVALNAAMNTNAQKPVKVFATLHSQAFMQAVRGSFGQILKSRNSQVGPVYLQTSVLTACLDQLAAERPGKADGYAFIRATMMALQQKSVGGTVLMMGTSVVGAPYHGQGRRHYPNKPVFSSSKQARQMDRDRVLRQSLEGPDGGFVENPRVARFLGQEPSLGAEWEEELVRDLLTPCHIAHSTGSGGHYRSREELMKAAREIGRWDIRF